MLSPRKICVRRCRRCAGPDANALRLLPYHPKKNPKACHALLPSSFRPAPGHVVLLPHAPQIAVLCHPAVRVFVTHGGLNSVHEGLTAGKPLLVLPFFGDQPVNACHVVNQAVGAALDPRKLRAESLARALRALLLDGGMAERAAALGKRLRAAQSGAERAARLLLEFGVGGAPEEA
jgi:UDP:flavonoid glycosyltransferase YjiC (YdhE family)